MTQPSFIATNGNSTFSYFPTNLPALLSTGIDVLIMTMTVWPDIFIIASLMQTKITVSALFHNTGSGNFTIDTTSFHQIFTGAVKWGDADSDGDLDILCDGIELDNDAFTLIYLNDGSGNFSELITNLPGTGEPGSVDWADIDNDGDHDVLLSSNLMRNDGSGNFTDISPWASLSVSCNSSQCSWISIWTATQIFMLSFSGLMVGIFIAMNWSQELQVYFLQITFSVS
ncbi:MAG: VCBS repeat-containing protein [Bacteroidetes bacterium]|nr:VCBS repeat-containing protein [Bacteroidota bacterium]